MKTNKQKVKQTNNNQVQRVKSKRASNLSKVTRLISDEARTELHGSQVCACSHSALPALKLMNIFQKAHWSLLSHMDCLPVAHGTELQLRVHWSDMDKTPWSGQASSCPASLHTGWHSWPNLCHSCPSPHLWEALCRGGAQPEESDRAGFEFWFCNILFLE